MWEFVQVNIIPLSVIYTISATIFSVLFFILLRMLDEPKKKNYVIAILLGYLFPVTLPVFVVFSLYVAIHHLFNIVRMD